MSASIHISREYPFPPAVVWRTVTEPDLVRKWTTTGRGGVPEGFHPEVGCRFRIVGRPLPGWDGIVRCEVLAVEERSLLTYSWRGAEDEDPTEVTYRLAPVEGGTRFDYDHLGFKGIRGFVLAKLILGPVRRRMLDVGLPAVLAQAGAASAGDAR